MVDDLRTLIRTGGPITTKHLLKEIELMVRLGTWQHAPLTKLTLEDTLGTMYASKQISFHPSQGWEIVFNEPGQKVAKQLGMFD